MEINNASDIFAHHKNFTAVNYRRFDFKLRCKYLMFYFQIDGSQFDNIKKRTMKLSLENCGTRKENGVN